MQHFLIGGMCNVLNNRDNRVIQYIREESSHRGGVKQYDRIYLCLFL